MNKEIKRIESKKVDILVRIEGLVKQFDQRSDIDPYERFTHNEKLIIDCYK